MDCKNCIELKKLYKTAQVENRRLVAGMEVITSELMKLQGILAEAQKEAESAKPSAEMPGFLKDLFKT